MKRSLLRVVWITIWLLVVQGAAARAQNSMNLQTDVYISGTDGYHSYRIPALVVTAKGTVLCFAEGRKNSVADHGDIDLLVKRSHDGGKSWSPQAIVHEEGGGAPITIGNPCPIVAHDGVVHLLFTRDNKDVFRTRSSDDGLTWSQPIQISRALKGFDFATMRVGTGPIHGIQTRSGRLLVPAWLCDGLANNKSRTYRCGVLYSDDRGETWLAGGLVPAGDYTQLNECAVFERADGSLMLNMRGAGRGVRSTSVSTDGGKSWSQPRLEKSLPCPTCQAGLLRLPTGELLFSNPAGDAASPGKGRKNLTARISRDDGETWSASRSIHSGPAGYSDLAYLPDGSILCAYEGGNKAYHEKIIVIGFGREWVSSSKQ